MKLSIIIPAYNLGETISGTLESIKRMSFTDSYEIIVVNDGSTDDTEAIVRSYQKELNTIKLYSINNQGVSNARNYGLSQSKGEYVTFVDGDDLIEPDFLQSAVNELEATDCDFIQYNYRIVDNNTHNYSYMQVVERDVVITDRNEMQALFFGVNKIIHNAVWGKVYKTSFLNQTSFDTSLKISEDQKFVFDLLLRAKKIKLKHALGYNYYQRSSSAMHTRNIEKNLDALRVLDYCITKCSDSEIIPFIQGQKLDVYFSMYNYTLVNSSKVPDEIYNSLINQSKRTNKACYDQKTYYKVLLLKYAPHIYNSIVKVRYRNV